MWYPAQSHYPDNVATSHCTILFLPSTGQGLFVRILHPDNIRGHTNMGTEIVTVRTHSTGIPGCWHHHPDSDKYTFCKWLVSLCQSSNPRPPIHEKLASARSYSATLAGTSINFSLWLCFNASGD